MVMDVNRFLVSRRIVMYRNAFRMTFILLAVFFACLLLPQTPVRAETISLSYANFPPAPTFPCVQMERWKTEVEKRTEGKVVINTFPGGTLLDAKDMMDGVIAGQADIGNLCMAYQPGRFVLTNAMSLPLGVPNARVGSLVLWELYQKYTPASFSKVKVLTMFTTAPSNIMSRKPVQSLADLKGMNIRASGGAAEILKAWGANQVGMPMSSTPEALQRGVVQGLFSSLEVLKDLKFAEVCPYVTLTETVLYPFSVVMNLDRWNSLPPEIQKVMDDLSLEQAEWTGTYMDDHVREAVEWSKKEHQVVFAQFSEADQAQSNALLAPMIDAWIQEAQAKGISGQAVIDDIRALIQKYDAR